MTIARATDKLFELLQAKVVDGCLSGGSLFPVMSKCDPPIANGMLKKIWSACDTKNAGKLTKPQVSMLLGYMAQAQTTGSPDPAKLSATTPPPTISGLTM
jgi:hypothetical protein